MNETGDWEEKATISGKTFHLSRHTEMDLWAQYRDRFNWELGVLKMLWVVFVNLTLARVT